MTTATACEVGRVRLSKGDQRIDLHLALGDPYTGGPMAAFADGAVVALECVDDFSAGFTPSQWLSGVASGVRYGFRALGQPLRRVWVRELSGRLGETAMDALASAAALGVAQLLGGPPLKTELAGWALNPPVLSRNGAVGNASNSGLD
jgi:hypothetical protein